MTQVYPSGIYAPLPQIPDNVFNPNHNVRVVKTFNGIYLINPNFRIHPSTNTTQSEVTICRNPIDQATMFVASNAVYPVGGYEFISEGVYVTTNSGVKLVVYDLLGREVRTLVNEFKQAGSYDVSFDASSLSSGVYFYRINAGDFTDVKKMMLIK
jgi:hypothetical protein